MTSFAAEVLIIVSKINNKFYAIEGNSRLACYKSLLKTSTHWKEIKSIVTQRELTKEEIYTFCYKLKLEELNHLISIEKKVLQNNLLFQKILILKK